jgi:phosphotransferase system enzyme I (PtsP)
MVVERYVNQFKNMQDPYMQERAVDVEDLGNRLLGWLLQKSRDKLDLPEKFVLIGEEVTASMLAEYPRDKLQGIVSIRGSNNSHAAIIARGMGLPAVMGLSGVTSQMLNQKDLLIDGYSGEIIVSPSKTAILEFQSLIDEEKELSSEINTQAHQPATSQDGCDMQLYINLGLSGELELTQTGMGSGVGLFRTEIPFMVSERFPTEKEQVELYSKVFEDFDGKTVVMRTLDIGGDKPLPYFPISEDNPFLGWRGIRFTLDHPEIFLIQVRGMIRASIGRDTLHILLPMVSNLSEIEEANRLLRQAFYEVKEEHTQSELPLHYPKLGVMIEVPSVMYQLPQIAQKADFLSVGSNDLTQYLLAVDRNNERVSSLHDSYHPAVLRALKHIVEEANQLDMPVSLCGELAGEAGGAILLMAMGYRKLSMNSYNLRKINWVIRNVSLQKAKALLEDVLTLSYPYQVKERVNFMLEVQGLGGLVRAGK